MKVTIKAEILQRFATLYKSLEPKVNDEIKCLRLELSTGKIILIGCNQYVACAELIAESNLPDEVCYIKVTEELTDYIRQEVEIGGYFEIETIPELAIASIKDSKNSTYNNVMIWSKNKTYDNWRKWFSTSDESKGFMYCTLYQVQTLFETSPTGEVVFPEILNNNEPVIIRDVNSDKWVGTFIPTYDGRKVLKPAKLPEWL